MLHPTPKWEGRLRRAQKIGCYSLLGTDVRFRVRYGDPAELIADHEAQFQKGGFLVRVDAPEGLELFEPVELEVCGALGSVVLEGQVVQVVPSVGVAVGFSPTDELRDLVEGGRAATPGGAPAEHEIAAERDASTRQAPVETYQKVKEAGKVDKIHMARYGKKDERMQIMRGSNRTLHRYVLQNPGLGVDEVVFIAKMSTVSPDLLKAIAERRDWAQRSEVAIALVRNPKTPVPIAIKMLNWVAPAELRALAKGSAVRMPILRAARKKVVG